MNYRLTILTLLFAFVGFAFGQQQYDTPFKVTYVSGHQLKFEPSLQNRICGTKEIQLLVPHNMSNLSHFVYDNIAYYFKELGLRVKTVKANFRNRNVQVSTVTGVWTELDPDEDLADYLHNANTLCVIANYVNAGGQYVSSITVHIDIVDYLNNFQWTERVELPNSGEKFIKRLRNSICNSYYYNDTYSFQPSYYTSTWNKTILKDNIDKNGVDPIEGIYKGDKYTLGVKKDSRDGKYYMIYLGGSDNDDWKEGDIKAILNPTATPTLFKADWYGKWKQKTDYTISFANGGFALIYQNKNDETYIKMYPIASAIGNAQPTEWTGTGFALKNNYVVTNYHVVDGAKNISIKGINGSFTKGYAAEVVATDKQNDLAILKVNGASIPSANIPYSVKTNTAEVGEEVFVLGYPLTSTMGEEIKLTTGVISSRSGFQGDVSLYQTTAPIQPGNSGGPLFDSKGNVIGIVSAKHKGAENVGYAIKASYLRNLIESSISSNILPQSNKIATLNLSGKVKSSRNYVYYIICSNKNNNLIAPVPSSSTKNTNTPPPSTNTPKTEKTQNTSEDYYNTGYRYCKGENYTEAITWFTKSANQGYARAQYELAILYAEGRGVEQNIHKAIEWYTKAANQGHTKAQYELAILYAEGRGVEQNIHKAIEWYTKAANQGHKDAQLYLGSLYENGHHVDQNYKKAFDWYLKAAYQGIAIAEYKIGSFCEEGKGVSQNYKNAYNWYSKAAEKGSEDAKKALKRLEKYSK